MLMRLVPLLVSLLVLQLRFALGQDVSAAQSAFSSFMQNPTISSLSSEMEAQTDAASRSSVSQAINSLIQSFVATYSVPGATATPSASVQSQDVSSSNGNSYIETPESFSSASTFAYTQPTSVDTYSATLRSLSSSDIGTTSQTNGIPTSDFSSGGADSLQFSKSSILTFGPTPGTETLPSSSSFPSSSSSSSNSVSPTITSSLSVSSSSSYDDAGAKASQRSYFFSWLSAQLGPTGAQQTADPFGQDPLIIWMSQWYETATDSAAKSTMAQQLSFISSIYAKGPKTTASTINTATSIAGSTAPQSTPQNPYYLPTASASTPSSTGTSDLQSDLSAFASSPSGSSITSQPSAMPSDFGSSSSSSSDDIFDNPTLQSLSRLFVTATDTAVAGSAASSINALFASLHQPNGGVPPVSTSSVSAATTFGVTPSSESVATTFGAPSNSNSVAYTFGAPSSSDSVAYTFGAPSSSDSVAYTFGAPSPESTSSSSAIATYGSNTFSTSVASTHDLITDSVNRNVTTALSGLGSETNTISGTIGNLPIYTAASIVLDGTNTSSILQLPLSYDNGTSLNVYITSLLDIPPVQNSSMYAPVVFQTSSSGISTNGSSFVFNFPNGAAVTSVHTLASLICLLILFL